MYWILDIKAGRLVSRPYRNRRIGEFLKELDFTEGRGTGVPKISRSLINNGSPAPAFYTDNVRQSFWTEIKIHPEFLESQHIPAKTYDGVHDRVYEGVQDSVLSQTEYKILNFINNANSG